MDSATIVAIALKYIDTISRNEPVDIIKIFNSDKDFIPDETSQVMEEINKSCLVSLGIDQHSRKPNDFIFYNDNGEIVYWGERWDPFPRGRDVYVLPQ